MKTRIAFALIAFSLFLLVGCQSKTEGDAKTQADSSLFAAYTDVAVYQNIPALVTKDSKIEKAEDYGEGNYIINVQGTTLEDYNSYLKTLEEAGFDKLCDNGEDAFEGNVYSTMFTKDNLSLQVTYVVALEKVMVGVSEDMELSEHLVYQDKYVANNIAGAQTKIYFPELNIGNGLSAIIQLKNGNFIVHDGGGYSDSDDLIDYLVELAPEGQTPIVEAWFMSHNHEDHTAALEAIAIDKTLSSQIAVEGFYFYVPSEGYAMFGSGKEEALDKLMTSFQSFQTSGGKTTPVYRPQFGQRYYFCDIMIDVVTTVEVLPFASLACYDFNDTSVFLMHHIEGQKYMTTGDGCHALQRIALEILPASYLTLDVYMVPHHAVNYYYYFIDHCKIKTAIIPRDEMISWKKAEEGEYFLSTVEEAFCRKDGMVILTFPYTVGTAEIVGIFD